MEDTLYNNLTEQRHECEICFKIYKNKRSLYIHKRIHSEPKGVFKCLQCSKFFKKGFKVKNILNQHLKTHTEERPFKCTLCVKEFKINKILNDHLRTHTK